jgi:hypothetical protein
LNPATAWAQLPDDAKAEKKKRNKAIPGGEEDDDDDTDESFLATSSSLTSSHSDKLAAGTLAVTRVKDANMADPTKVSTILLIICFMSVGR